MPDAARYALERQPVEAVIERVLRDGTLPDVRSELPCLETHLAAAAWLLRTSTLTKRRASNSSSKNSRGASVGRQGSRWHLERTTDADPTTRFARADSGQRCEDRSAASANERRGQGDGSEGEKSTDGPRCALAHAARGSQRQSEGSLNSSMYITRSCAITPVYKHLERGEAQVGLRDLDAVREDLVRLLGRDRRVNDDLASRLPVGGRGDPVLVAELERVDRAQDLVELTAGRRRVLKNQTDRLLRVDDEHGSDGERDALLVDVGEVLLVEHVVQASDLTSRISDDRELEVDAAQLVDVGDPLVAAA